MNPQEETPSIFRRLFIDTKTSGSLHKIENLIKKFKPAERLVFYILVVVMVISATNIFVDLNNLFLVEVPGSGGSFSEATIGAPRFINPVLSISDTDKALTSLVYSSILKQNTTGNFVGDLAESFSVSEDGLVYDIKIRSDAVFHDKSRVTTEDILFTIEKTLDPIIKSPRRSAWEGVMVEKISDTEIRFTLKKPYYNFLESLSIGILPKHIWQNASSEEFPFSQLNINPIGSGPYKIESIKRNSAGIPTSISLEFFDKYHFGEPKIRSINFVFFANEKDAIKAYTAKSVDSISNLSQESAKAFTDNIIRSSMPRVFGVFFNQNNAPALLDSNVREALLIATPKSLIVSDVLQGFGKILNGPLPTNTEDMEDSSNTEENIIRARELLLDNGWKDNEEGTLEKKTKTETLTLKFSISTSDSEDLKRTAAILKSSWEKMGAKIEVNIFESSDLNQNVIKTRKYDALLFGEVIGVDGDLYPFWHSSQRNDPGLNISLYANITTDKILENLRTESDQKKREEQRNSFMEEISKDIPAIFLFTPDFIYLPPAKVKNPSLRETSLPSERFYSVSSWYIETEKVWRMFAN
jgi:peptide/nickel transport system substrate-binding protein